MMEHLFTCIVCGRDVSDYRHRNGRDRHIAPLCRGCESYYGDRSPQAGAFMDRRIATRVSALANALCGEAHAKQWSCR